MWLIIFRPECGDEIEVRRKLGPDEPIDAEHHAREWCDNAGVELDDDFDSGYIPNCCGDLRVEFRDDPDNSVHIWTGQSFYFKHE